MPPFRIHVPRRQCGGYTLLELVVVVSILALLAVVTLPGTRPSASETLDLAASRVAQAIRFARMEAIRTGNPVYVEINRNTDRLLVAQANLAGATVAAGATLRDPVNKQPLDIILSADPVTAGVDVTNDPFNYATGGRQASVVFDARGLPFSKAGGNYRLMSGGDIALSSAGRQRTVYVDRITGRVRIQ
ncbi:MAG: GspH/FimT family pseudopilin [Gammaproteobacteria bacterium]|nr:GspH/FimT family pseudopilin [Gammaproteobacteria bacterium]